jgi:hypothetical protein
VFHVFYVTGPLLVAWALLVSFLGIVREGFPNTTSAERLVGVVSVLLVAGAIAGAVSDAVRETKDGEGGEKAAAVLPS